MPLKPFIFEYEDRTGHEGDLVATLHLFYEALDDWPPDYPGGYRNYVCALARECQEVIGQSAWSEHLKSAARSICEFQAFVRFISRAIPDGVKRAATARL